jgi:hypothetical protein
VANLKITDLDQYTNPVSTDVLPVVDIGANITKKISIADLFKNASAGTAAAPGIAFDNESNTGIFSPGADQLGIATGGIQRLVVDGGGNLAVTGNLEIGSTSTLTFEGSTADTFETTLGAVDPTADRSILLPNVSGTVVTTGDTGTVTSTMLADGTIVDGDISATAEIAVSKLADGTARQLLQTDAAGTGVEWASNIDIPGTLDVTGAATFDQSVTVNGDLIVNGTTTTLNTATLTVDDKNIELGSVASPSDATADLGGITLKGATDKTFNWVSATGSWTSSEHINLAVGKVYYINGTQVLGATALGTGVVSSSLTSVGTISTGTWQGTTIGIGYGGTGQTTYSNGQLLIGKTDGTLAKATLTASTGISITNGDGSITVAVATQPAIADITTTATAGTLPTADGSVTIADAAAPTVGELLEYCTELEAKLETALTALRNFGLIAT